MSDEAKSSGAAETAGACGERCPVGRLAGLVRCTLEAGHEGDHEVQVERRPGAWDTWETWPRKASEGR